MKGVIFVWGQFIICTLVILFASVKLSKYGDMIAEKSGLGRTWIGVALMASVTSLPEFDDGRQLHDLLRSAQDCDRRCPGHLPLPCRYRATQQAFSNLRSRRWDFYPKPRVGG
jgi:hypothetical protein